MGEYLGKAMNQETRWAVEGGRLKIWRGSMLIADMALEFVVYSIIERLTNG